MPERTEIERVANAIAAAIAAKDDTALTAHLAPGFVLRRPGGAAVEAAAFAAGVREQPIEVLGVQIEQLEIDVVGDTAVATGVQSVRVREQGETLEDRQPLAFWFVKRDGRWQLQVSVDYSDW